MNVKLCILRHNYRIDLLSEDLSGFGASGARIHSVAQLWTLDFIELRLLAEQVSNHIY